MPVAYSSTFKRTVNASGAAEVPRILLEINNAALLAPIRVVNDNADLTSNGHLFVANLTRSDGDEFLPLAARIPVRVETQSFPLEAANEALAMLRAGHLSGAAVLVP